MIAIMNAESSMIPQKRKTASPFANGVTRAWARIHEDILKTPLEYSPALSLMFGAHVYLKWECGQITGSFKLRGALNKIRTLSPGQKRQGVVSASTGNHGLAMSYAAGLEGVALTLYLPENAAPAKIAKIRRSGANVRFHGTSCEKTEMFARREADKEGRVFVSPYNDLDVIYGQGTVGLEILDQVRDPADVLVPVGGGGLIAGIGGYLKSECPGAGIIGCEPARSAFMAASLKAGRLVDFKEKKTLADAVAGGIEPGSVTFPLCRKYVDDILTVSERALARAMRAIHAIHGRIVEGAGALPLAVLMTYPARFKGRRVVLVLSGQNISRRVFQDVCRGAGIRL
jgi:threonine dehydratase